MGMFGMCACDFWVTRFGWVPVPRIQNNDMLLRVSARIRHRATAKRAFYTIASYSSSRLLGFPGARFSHFRKRIASFSWVDDQATYQLKCNDADPLARGELKAQMNSVSKVRPDTSIFTDIQAATEFLFNLDGSCGYSFRQNKLSFQEIDYPQWDMYFCHDCSYRFPLLDHLIATFQIDAELDCVLFMQNTPQTRCSSWLYDQEGGHEGISE